MYKAQGAKGGGEKKIDGERGEGLLVVIVQ
jgi:hypothetical protein